MWRLSLLVGRTFLCLVMHVPIKILYDSTIHWILKLDVGYKKYVFL
jgi:hypothetical protein